MYFGGVLLGYSTFNGYPDVVKTSEYNKMTVYGKQTINYIKCLDYVMSETEMDAISLNDVQTWNTHTKFLASFNNSINGGNIDVSEQITSFNIQRLEDDESVATDLGQLDVAQAYFEDFEVGSNIKTKYLITPITSDKTGTALESETVTPVWECWSITDPVLKTVYKLMMDVNIGDISNIVDHSVISGFTKFDQVVHGERDYLSGKFSITIGKLDCSSGEYSCPEDLIESFRKFINNGNIKILKNTRGSVFYVDTWESDRTYKDEYIQKPATVTFSFQEIANSLN